MTHYFRSLLLIFTSLFALSVATPAVSADKNNGPEYKYVLHVDDMDPSKYELALNNAQNLLNAYAPGDVEIEIVAYGPGLRLLFAKNEHAQRINDLALSGVKFSACGNTIKGMTKLMGEAPQINPTATVVPGGIVRIGELVHQGYIYVKP